MIDNLAMRPLQNAPFCSISASGSNFNPRNILYIPVVEIFAFLDLNQISADFEIEHFSKVSISILFFQLNPASGGTQLFDDLCNKFR